MNYTAGLIPKSIILVALFPILFSKAFSQGRPPWENPLRIAWSSDGLNFTNDAIFQDSSGVPCALKWKGDTLACVFQWFRQPRNSPTWDRVAVKFSYDAGKTWTTPVPIKIEGLPQNYQRPFDPTLVATNKDSLRIFFSSSNGLPSNGLDSTINTYSALGTDGINYRFEPNPRFDHPTKQVIDPAVAFFKGTWHYAAPAGAPQDGAYHGVSSNGVNFTSKNNYPSDNAHNWTGNFAVENGDELRFYGSGASVWFNTSQDGYTWANYQNTNLKGGDPSIVKLAPNNYMAIYVGQPYNGQADFRCGDTLLDTRDGKRYATVLIGTDCWMKQNLNFGKMVPSQATAALHSDMFNNGIPEKYAMHNDSNNLKIYGGLYEWNELMNYSNASIRGLCPNGWHVSTDGEWKNLIQIAGGTMLSNSGGRGGNKLKTIGTGFGAGAGTNTVGFSAKFSGDRDGFGIFYGLNLRSIFWTSTPANQNQAIHYTLWAENDTIQRLILGSNTGFACRCVKDKLITDTHEDINPTNNVKIYPNPAKNQVVILGEGIESIVIFDIRGQKVVEKQASANPMVVSLEGLSMGVYVVQITHKNGFLTRKLIKE